MWNHVNIVNSEPHRRREENGACLGVGEGKGELLNESEVIIIQGELPEMCYKPLNL